MRENAALASPCFGRLELASAASYRAFPAWVGLRRLPVLPIYRSAFQLCADGRRGPRRSRVGVSARRRRRSAALPHLAAQTRFHFRFQVSRPDWRSRSGSSPSGRRAAPARRSPPRSSARIRSMRARAFVVVGMSPRDRQGPPRAAAAVSAQRPRTRPNRAASPPTSPAPSRFRLVRAARLFLAEAGMIRSGASLPAGAASTLFHRVGALLAERQVVVRGCRAWVGAGLDHHLDARDSWPATWRGRRPGALNSSLMTYCHNQRRCG